MGASINRGGGGRRGRRGVSRARMAEINVTPFVDVMLVLLIVFMVAAPLMSVGVPLQLPQTAAQPLPSENEPPFAIDIDAEGQIFIEGEETPIDNLIRIVGEQAGDNATERKIYIRADRAADYGSVMRVMALLQSSGYRRITFPTESAGRAPEPAQ